MRANLVQRAAARSARLAALAGAKACCLRLIRRAEESHVSSERPAARATRPAKDAGGCDRIEKCRQPGRGREPASRLLLDQSPFRYCTGWQRGWSCSLMETIFADQQSSTLPDSCAQFRILGSQQSSVPPSIPLLSAEWVETTAVHIQAHFARPSAPPQPAANPPRYPRRSCRPEPRPRKVAMPFSSSRNCSSRSISSSGEGGSAANRSSAALR